MQRTKTSPTTEALLIEAFKSTGYLIVNKTLIKQLGLLPAVMLSNLIDKHVYFKENHGQIGSTGWFYLTHECQTEQIGLSDHQIRKTKKELLEKGFIEVKRQGVPAKEWYKINFDVLYKGLVLKNLKDLSSKNLRTYINENKYNENKEIKLHSSKKSSPEERVQKYLSLTNRLYDIIRTNKNVCHSSSQLKAWAHEVRKLAEVEQIDYARIERVLDWYADNIGGQYVPVIESGFSLRSKFLRLEAAMERDSKQYAQEYIIEDGQRWEKQSDGTFQNKQGVILPQ